MLQCPKKAPSSALRAPSPTRGEGGRGGWGIIVPHPPSLPGSSRQSTPPLARGSPWITKPTLSPCGRGTGFLRSAEIQGEGLRAVPQGKSLQWSDLREEGHESYARMARSRPCFNAQTKAPSSALRAPSPARGEGGRGGWGIIVPKNHPLPSSPIKGEVLPRWLGRPPYSPTVIAGLVPAIHASTCAEPSRGSPGRWGGILPTTTPRPASETRRAGAPALSRAAGGRFGEGGRWNRCCAGRYWRRRARRKAPW